MEGTKLIAPECVIRDRLILNAAGNRKAASAKDETRLRREWLNLSGFTHTADTARNNMRCSQPG
jgi:hypothetical protein